MTEMTALLVAVSLVVTAGVSVWTAIQNAANARVAALRSLHTDEKIREVHVLVNSQLTKIKDELSTALSLLSEKYDDTTLERP